MQSFTAPKDGTYKIECWGAQGFAASQIGKGGYSYGNKILTINNSLYICVGNYHVGPSRTYNGGGSGDMPGGGATHIALTNRGELKNYSLYQSEVLIVAGGGGGSDTDGGGGNGGGEIGNNGIREGGTGGTQSSGGAGYNNGNFGFGGDAPVSSNNDSSGGGGGGWYGGGSSQSCWGDGGGGSGHINTNYITNGHMDSGIREGDGYAIISQISFIN